MRRTTNHKNFTYFAMLALILCLSQPRSRAQNIYYTGFENAQQQQGWHADNGVWQIGTPPAASGPGAAYDGSQCAGTGMVVGYYPGNVSSRLVSPPITLPSLASGQQILLTFFQWFQWSQNTDYGAAIGTGDVQVSVWNSANSTWGAWTSIGNAHSNYYGTSSGWSLASVDISAYANNQVQIGFQHNGGGYTAPGWYVDDVGVNIVSIQSLPYIQGFESATKTNWSGWSADNGVWQIGAPPSTSGPGAAYDGSQCAGTAMLAGAYPGGNVESRLVSPAITLPNALAGQQILLTFAHWFVWSQNTDYGASIGTGDIQVSTWNAVTGQWGVWTTISNVTANPSGNLYNGNSPEWGFASVDLSMYAGQQVQVGFQHNGGGYGAPGWYIDDVVIQQQPTPALALNQPSGFENTTNTNWLGWSADNGVWQVGAPPPTSGPGAAHDGSQCAGTAMQVGSYGSNTSSRLISPVVSLPAVGSGDHIYVTYYQWFSWSQNTDYGAAIGTGYVQVSEWNVNTSRWGAWQTVSNQYYGSSNGWTEAAIDLTAFAGNQILIGFQHNGGGYTAPGWYIDDVTVVLPAPTITSFNPTSGGPGTSVTINGTYFDGATQVAFNGTPASYTVVSGVEITATVPSGATTGPITVTTPGGTGTSAQDFTVTVPTANPQTIAVPFNTTTNITLTGTDPNGLTLTYEIASNPTHGTLGTLNASTGAVTYTPNAGYNGTDSFTFTVSDTNATSTAATVTLNVAPGVPTANPQTVNVSHNAAKSITLTGSDPDSPALPITFAIAAQPAHGSLSGLNSSTGAVTYTPNNNSYGADSFTFTVSNGVNTSAAAVVTLKINAGTPTANAQTVSVAHNVAKAITLTGTDSSDSPPPALTFALTTRPSHGTLGTLNSSTGVIIYTPKLNYQGGDSFTFTVSNGINLSASATVTINVAAGTPTATAQTVAVAHNAAKSITLTGTDPDNPALPLTFSIATPPAHGKLDALNAATGVVTYTPPANYQGADSFTFKVSNGTNTSSAATVTLKVAPGVPTANAQTVSVAHNTSTVITLTGTDPDSPPLQLTYTIKTEPMHGTLSGLNATTGKVTYTPGTNKWGADSFTFAVSNGVNVSASVTVTLNVGLGVPTATPQKVTVGENGSITITLRGADLDNPAPPLTYAIASQPSHGTLSGLNATAGTVTYKPNANYHGADGFTFTVSNPANTSAPATVTINVSGG